MPAKRKFDPPKMYIAFHPCNGLTQKRADKVVLALGDLSIAMNAIAKTHTLCWQDLLLTIDTYRDQLTHARTQANKARKFN